MNRNEVIEKMIKWFRDREGNVTYSMINRTGDKSFDCSSSLYYAICYAMNLEVKYPFSTETEHEFLLTNGFEKIADNEIWQSERGDIFILGRKGFSSGAGGHTGIYLDKDRIIHCNYLANGISVDKDSVLDWDNYGWYGYRLKKDFNDSIDVTKMINERYRISGNYSIDSLPWCFEDRKNIGNTKDYNNKIVTVTRKWGYYWYVKEFGGFVDYRAFKREKSIDEIAIEIINGFWGNGEIRKQNLENAGYNYEEVQSRVNDLI